MGTLKPLTQISQKHKTLILSLLKTFKPQTLSHLKTLHLHLIQSSLTQDNFAIGNFVTQCSTLSTMDYASLLFGEMSGPNSFVWNNMIRGYQQTGRSNESLLMFRKMRVETVFVPDKFASPFIVRACSDLNLVGDGRGLHGLLVKFCLDVDVFVGTSLIEFYRGFGEMGMAENVFRGLSVRDAVSETALLTGYVEGGNMKAAERVFEGMPVKDVVAWNTMINGFVKNGDVDTARKYLEKAPMMDVMTYNTVLGGYMKYGKMDDVLDFFEKMMDKDVVSWNTVIGGLVDERKSTEAMRLFERMQKENVKPNIVTLVRVLSACALTGALDKGRWIHQYIDRNKLSMNVKAWTALVDMYSKCGELESAQRVFHCMEVRDVVAWNAMIRGFSMNGQSKHAMEFFYKMIEEDVKPTEVTMVGVLTACSHSGLVDEARKCFARMQEAHGITPSIEHYGCMVDVLSRAGLLNEALKFIRTMPLVPHTGVWGALLNACKIYRNVELAEIAIEHLMELGTEDGGYLSIMSNIYANAGRWNDVFRVREIMKVKEISKLPGCSSIEINGEIHEFGAEGKIHTRSKEIYRMIDEISKRLNMAGHVASTTEVFFDVEVEEKEKALFFHSEKLAIAFGLIATDKRAVIRVVKNLRVCLDCHAAIKLISKIFDREIVVRDRHRFHHFKDGICSCGDYW